MAMPLHWVAYRGQEMGREVQGGIRGLGTAARGIYGILGQISPQSIPLLAGWHQRAELQSMIYKGRGEPVKAWVRQGFSPSLYLPFSLRY
eukprot:1145234-Pelagomonas_calceolata.AAC.1